MAFAIQIAPVIVGSKPRANFMPWLQQISVIHRGLPTDAARFPASCSVELAAKS